MARPNQQSNSDAPSDPQEWQALRSELVALLAEVEGRQPAGSRPAEIDVPAGRPQDTRAQSAGQQRPPAPPEARRREALRSVKRAVDRMSERDDGEPTAPANPRAALDAAIGEIRARQRSGAAPGDAAADGAPRFDTLARAVEGIAGRLEQFEADLQAQRHTGASVRDIAEQVTQVSQVVELLAGAVGETGQVKRLEAQIEGLARLISEGHRVDLGAVTRRIDEVSATVARLADIQIQHAARDKEVPLLAQRLDDVSATVERLADIQIQQVGREKEMPGLSARIGQVLQAVERLASMQAEISSRQQDMPALGERVNQVLQAVERLAEMQAAGAAREAEFIPALGARIGNVSDGLERLVDMQTMHVRAVKDVPAQHDALRAGMQAIEKGVRNVYDRIDAIEKNYVLPPAEFERLTGELARFTQAMQDARQPQGLVDLVDALNARIGDIESRDSDVDALKAELAALRGSVIEAIEPRMAAIETRIEALHEQSAALGDVGPRMAAIQSQLEALSERGSVLYDVGPRMDDLRAQLEALNERVAERPASEPSMAQIEAQVRQLVARMDQTGEQLSGLARLYSEGGEREREAGTDYEALAEMVATRTSQAMREEGLAGGMSADDISEFEQRMSQLLRAATDEAGRGDAFGDVTDGIRRVDERLERLEAALNRLAEETSPGDRASGGFPPEPAQEAAIVPVPRAAAAAMPSPARVPVQSFEEEPVPVRRPDSMPHDPAEERPLVDRAFPDLGPVREALEARLTTRPRHPGLNDPDDAGDHPDRPGVDGPRGSATPPQVSGFDPATVPRPPRPSSTLETIASEDFDSGTVPSQQGDEPPAPGASRSAFIEAARRAAQRQASGTQGGGETSLIARALARFQIGQGKPAVTPAKTKVGAKPAPRPEPKADGKGKNRKSPPAASRPEPVAPDAPPIPVVDVSGAVSQAPGTDPDKQSFLERHRQPILLAASVVALAFLTINLVNQRLAEQQADAIAAAPVDTGAIEAVEASNPPGGPAAIVPPRVITMTDGLQTGAIDPAAARGFVPSDELPPMPQAFAAAAPSMTASPVKVELPPETVGPLDLRQAAADGDPRAQFEIGAIYTEGRAVPQNLELAAIWYERAAAQGFAPAQYRLGNLYENGRGVTKDLEQARLWYQRAAEGGNRMSMHNLAALYAGGQLGRQEFASAAEWFEKAAEQGLTDSQFNLGMLFARGLGVPQNMQESYRWFAIAARSGDTDAASARDDVAKSLDAATVTRINDEIEAWAASPIDLAANFAPIGTWSASFDPGEPISTPEVVKGVQTLLARLGFDVGTPDGVAGPKTAEAIRQFEKATGMSESGAINPRLLAVLSSQPV